MGELWLTDAKLITPHGIIGGALKVAKGHIAAVGDKPPRGAVKTSLCGGYLAPGFIDLHVWGDPAKVSREIARQGTSTFLASVGPAPHTQTINYINWLKAQRTFEGAQCAGLHIEGPFLNPSRAGALPKKWMRKPTVRQMRDLRDAAGAMLKLITMAPELPGAIETIRWCSKQGITVSLGHSESNKAIAGRAVEAGARGVTHVFNGMPRFNHRAASLLDVALAEPRLTTMVIADGVHVSPSAFRMLVKTKGAEGIALVTDSVKYKRDGLKTRRGAYYTSRGILAGSSLTMIDAVRNTVSFSGVSLSDAVRMASAVPARLAGLGRTRGSLEVSKRADLVGFDKKFRVLATVVGGRVVFSR